MAAQPRQPVRPRPPRSPARRIATAAARTPRAVTVRKGGQHALMAEFLLFLGIVGMRAIADYVPGDQGQPTEGTAKGAVTPRSGQLGPLPILAAGFTVFFVLSFLAARGGTWAKVAAAFGLVVDVALLMKSLPELNTVSQGFHNATATSQAGQGGQAGQSGTAGAGAAVGSSIAQGVGAAEAGLGFQSVPDATGIFPIVTPNVPPVAQGVDQNPNVFTQP